MNANTISQFSLKFVSYFFHAYMFGLKKLNIVAHVLARHLFLRVDRRHHVIL